MDGPACATSLELTERLVVFTAQQAPSAAYESFVVDQVKLDIRQLLRRSACSASRCPPTVRTSRNVTKLKSLGTERWTRLVDLIAAHRYDVDPAEIRRICGIKPANEEQQTNAIIGNMVRVVDALHDPSSQMLRALKTALGDGKLCVVDISQLRGQRGLQLASIILAEIFAHNASEFTKARPQSVPCIAVVEEAQAVLGAGGGSGSAEDSPFVSWVKEGRKYGLGAVLVTQQPGSIPAELLSQGDNFFVFHLLSAGDLFALKRATAHFSDDLLATLLNEPLVGHGVFWSSAPGTDRSARPYPLPVRVLSFEAEHRQRRDPSYSGEPVDCYAAGLRERFRTALAAAVLYICSTAGAAASRSGHERQLPNHGRKPNLRLTPSRHTGACGDSRACCASAPSSPAAPAVERPGTGLGAGSRQGWPRPHRRKRSSATASTGQRQWYFRRCSTSSARKAPAGARKPAPARTVQAHRRRGSS